MWRLCCRRRARGAGEARVAGRGPHAPRFVSLPPPPSGPRRPQLPVRPPRPGAPPSLPQGSLFSRATAQPRRPLAREPGNDGGSGGQEVPLLPSAPPGRAQGTGREGKAGGGEGPPTPAMTGGLRASGAGARRLAAPPGGAAVPPPRVGACGVGAGCGGPRSSGRRRGPRQAAAVGAERRALPRRGGQRRGRGPTAGQGARGGWPPCSKGNAGQRGRGGGRGGRAGSRQPSPMVSAANAVSLLLRSSPCEYNSPATAFSRKEANPISRFIGPAASR